MTVVKSKLHRSGHLKRLNQSCVRKQKKDLEKLALKMVGKIGLRLIPIFSPANNQKSFLSDLNPISHLKRFAYDGNPNPTVGKSSLKLITDLKFFFYGQEILETEDEGRFGDIDILTTLNITETYFDTFSPDGVMIQMSQGRDAQNFLNHFHYLFQVFLRLTFFCSFLMRHDTLSSSPESN